jgi:integrase
MRKLKLKPTTVGIYTLGNLKRGGINEAVVTWRLPNGKRRRFRLGKELTQEQADAELYAFVKQREVFLTRSGTTVQELYDAYMADKELDNKPTENQRQHWKALRGTFGPMNPDDIDKATCRNYERKRLKEGRKIGTVWTELTALRAILGWAEDAKKIAKAPAIAKPAKPEPKDLRLTREQAQTLLEHCDHAHTKLFVILALQTAARMGAILDLTWDRVDFGGSESGGFIDLRDPDREQTSKRRVRVPMTGTARAALSQARQFALSPYVVEWHARGVDSVKRAIRKAAADAGMPWISAHVLRHTAASWMAEAGVSMSEISQYLGHTSTRITERVYARYSPEHLRKAAAALEMPQAHAVVTKKAGGR